MSYGEIQEYEGHGGEVIQAQEVTLDALGSLTRAEIDSQVATAKRCPRSINKAIADARSLACLTPQVAESCCYAVPRGGKTIEGPSVRLAEIMAYSFGNLRVAARITHESDRFVIAQATALDLEKNNGVQIEVRRLVRWNNPKLKEDAINLAASQAISVAFRNAVFKCVPSAFVQPIYREARRLAAGGGKSIEDRRKNVKEWIASIGVKDAELFQAIGVRGWEDIGLDQMGTIAGLMTAIKDGECSIDEAFRPSQAKPDALPAPSKADSLAADLAAKVTPQPEPAEAPAEKSPAPRKSGKLFPGE